MMIETPLVVVNVQRGGPSTGLPTKTEQSDLLQAMYGRNSESPVIIVAASTPANWFDFAYEAARLTLEHMTPVILLTDGYIANGSAPWKIKTVDEMKTIKPTLIDGNKEDFHPYDRDEKLARNWAIPGTPGLEHRVGGLEKDSVTGDVCYVPENHEHMTKIRAEKILKVADNIPAISPEFCDEGDVLVVGWGGTYGSLQTAVKEMHQQGINNIGLAHFNYINPLPKNTEEVLSRFKKIVVCELNNGQFISVLRNHFPQFHYEQHNKIQGLPFANSELIQKFNELLD